jgi:biopolymer transport protein ExbD
MPLKRQRQSSQLPEVNLIPMMDVLMTVLTFFIIISMTMTGQATMGVRLPDAAESTSQFSTLEVEPFVVGLNQDQVILIQNLPVTERELRSQLRDYLAKNPEGMAILKADQSLSYDQVAHVLTIMRDVGGDRISLGIGR